MGRTSRFSTTRWTNPSVIALAGDADPIETITARAREAVLAALDQGWSGPPFDPLVLARMMRIETEANSDVRDARTVPAARGAVRIEFNPEKPRGRMRYSIAHEIAHTLFPDCAEQVRNRSRHHELEGDEWQLEALCNIAAAEFLMPSGSIGAVAPDALSAATVLELQRRFDVSTEALVLRLAETSDVPVAAFCASPGDATHLRQYHLDYVVPSPSWSGVRIPKKTRVPRDSVVATCTAIGYSAHGVETWSNEGEPWRVEAIGIPPYPGSTAPRVVGLFSPADRGAVRPCIDYVFGSATEPRDKKDAIVVHVVNDKTVNWGGGGFAVAVRSTWPVVQADFKDWAEHSRASFRLGAVRLSRVSENLRVASIVAQHGYGPSESPRIRYAALRRGLEAVAQEAAKSGATVHMPRVGAGQAGGRWSVVEEIVRETLCGAGVAVTVYDLPGTQPRTEPQIALQLDQFGQTR